MKPNIQLPKVRNTSWLAQEKNKKTDASWEEGGKRVGKKKKFKGTVWRLPMKGNEIAWLLFTMQHM